MSKIPPKTKIEIVKSPPKLDAQQLLDVWSSEAEMEHVLIVGITKEGRYKYGTSEVTFEFLALMESVIQKWKLSLLDMSK